MSTVAIIMVVIGFACAGGLLVYIRMMAKVSEDTIRMRNVITRDDVRAMRKALQALQGEDETLRKEAAHDISLRLSFHDKTN